MAAPTQVPHPRRPQNKASREANRHSALEFSPEISDNSISEQERVREARPTGKASRNLSRRALVPHAETPQTPSPAQIPNPRGYTETPLKEAAGVHFPKTADEMPNHIPHDVIVDPNNTSAREQLPPRVSSKDRKKAHPLAKGIAIGAIGAAAAGFGGYTMHQQFAAADRTEQGTSYDMGVENQQQPNIDTATPDQFFNDEYFTDIERVQWADQQLDTPSNDPEYPGATVAGAAFSRLKDYLMENNGVPINSMLTESSESNTPNEANVQILSAVAAAVYELDENRAEKLLAGAFDNNSELMSAMRNNIHDLREEYRQQYGGEITQEFLHNQNIAYSFTPYDPDIAAATGGDLVPQATGISTNAPIGNIYPVNGEPTRVVMMTVSQTENKPPDYEMVQAIVGDRWIGRDFITPNDVNLWIPPSQLAQMRFE